MRRIIKHLKSKVFHSRSVEVDVQKNTRKHLHLYSIRGRVFSIEKMKIKLNVPRKSFIFVHINELQRLMLIDYMLHKGDWHIRIPEVIGIPACKFCLKSYPEGTEVGLTFNHVLSIKKVFGKRGKLDLIQCQVMSSDSLLVAEIKTH